ncbi:hypothetical protein IH979_00840, partial [Patescibacteria group bacterium]|nr:hypothetical protein [Patescibacteria group bacterium]
GDITCTDCLDFTDFGDSMSLDASTTIVLGASSFNINLDSTGDFVVRDGGTAFFTFNDDQTIDYTTTTDAIIFQLTANSVTTSNVIDISANALTTGTIFNPRSSAAFSGDLFQAVSSGAATGRMFFTSISNASASVDGYVITNAGTGESVRVDQNGNTGSTVSDSDGGAIHVGNTGNDGLGLSVFSDNNATQSAPLVQLEADNAAFDEAVLFIQQDGTGNGIFIDQNGNGIALNIDSEATTVNLAVLDGSVLTSGDVINATANALTTGSLIDFSSSGTFSGNLIDLNATGAATGNFIDISSTSATATAAAINIDLDNGNNNNDVFILTSDETTISGTAVDTVKARITASGEFLSDVGFSAGGATTTYRDAAITSAAAFTYTSPTSFTWEDDVSNTLMTLTDNGSTGTLALGSGDITCTDCLDFTDFGDSMSLDASTTIALGASSFNINLDSTGDFVVRDGGTAFFTFNDDRSIDYISTQTTTDAFDLTADSLTTAFGIHMSIDGLTTGNALRVESTSSALTSGDLIRALHSATYTSTETLSGSMLDLTRSLTINSGLDTLSVTGALVSLSNSGTVTAGTLADSSRLLFVDQNFTSASGDVLFVENAGTGSGITIDQNGDSGSVNGNFDGGALHVSNTQNDGFAITVHSNNNATQNAPLVDFSAVNSAFDQPILRMAQPGTGGGIDMNYTGSSGTVFDILNVGTGSSIFVDANGNTGSTVSDAAGGAIHITNTGNDGLGLSVFSNNGATQSAPLVQLEADSTAFDEDVLFIQQDGTGDGIFIDQNGNGRALFIDTAATSAVAIDVIANTANFALRIFNDGGLDTHNGIQIQACADATPGADCDYVKFRDGNGTILGAIEGNGSGGVTNASAGGDYAELFPGTYASFSEGDVLALDSSGNIALASGTSSVIGVLSTSPNVLGNWVEDWETLGIYVPVALIGQVQVNVDDSGGSISPGDYLTLSSTNGVAMKANGPAYVIGRALEAHASGSGTIDVYIQQGWHAGGTIDYDGTNNRFADDFIFAKTADANVVDQGKASQSLTFRGSGWNGASADDVDMVLLTDVTDSDDYRLSVQNDAGVEVAFINDEGDLAIAGRFYPSDRGTLQTDKYIYYDGSGAPTLDYMRTNAAGWGTGSYDFAEMFPSRDSLVAGEVVIFSDDDEHVRRSVGTTYDAKIAGIVSTSPGFLAGDFLPGHVPIALAGRVPTYVSGENGDITPGDPLTSSSKPGYAMKATKPGPIVGYAMEPFSGGTGSIIVFVRPSYYDGGPVSDVPAANNTVSGGSGNYSQLDVNGTLNMNGGSIISIGSLAGISTNWRLDENGNFYTKGRYVHLVKSYQNEEVEVYGVLSRETTIQLSGTAEMKNGLAQIDFEDVDPKFNDVISTTQPYRVFITAFDATGQLYAVNRTVQGFEIRESGGSSSTNVDWLVIAYHKDYEPIEKEETTSSEPPVEEPPVEEPPAEEPPAEELPAEPPVEEPPAEEPAAEEPPVEEPPAEESPSEEPLIEEPQAEEPPAA